MPIDYTAAKFWMDVAQIVATFAIGIYVWWTGRTRATYAAIREVDKKQSGRHDQLETRLDRHSDRLLVLEKDIKALPTESHISDLYSKMNALNREMGELASQLESTSGLIRMHSEYLMNKKD